ncbi:TlpA disulfide reductase family protein [uncultured Nevskia sp.]|uniref:TlpA family protein disulfide reductase n=1 Tax=uncultured Nevskia sp. TaxID=228950 RepID=UPI0025F06795|nr:TlpA disulfide reductase family protein [uncultured Nevskia sp.]
MSKLSTVLVIGACLLAAAGGYGLSQLQHGGEEHAHGETPSTQKPGTTAAAPSESLPAGIALSDLDGHKYSLDDYKGKLMIVNFWATWCAPCLNEIPILVKMQERYGAKGFQLIGPAVDDVEEARRAAPGLKFNYPVAVGTPEDMLELMSTLGNDQGGLPFSVVIAPDGRIIERQLGEYSEVELAGLIEKYLPH